MEREDKEGQVVSALGSEMSSTALLTEIRYCSEILIPWKGIT